MRHTNHNASLDHEAQESLLLRTVEIQPSDQDATGVSNSERISWLELAYELLRVELLPEAPSNVSISFGFPSTGARQSRNQRLGEYAHAFVKGTGEKVENTGLISLHPTIFNDPSRVLDVLLHEMIHAAVPEAGHRRPFRKLAIRCGLTGKMTATVATLTLMSKFQSFLNDLLPPMPPGYGDLAPRRKKQTTRMLKYTCPDCSQIIRAANDNLYCVCGNCDELYLPD